MTEKSRHIPLLTFLEVLQIEYLIAELRARIYRKPKDKQYWKDRVMFGKKEKIDDISDRNPEAVTIFNSEKELTRIKSQIFKPFGLPNFHYKNEEQRLELENKDFFAYFGRGCSITVRTSDNESKSAILKEISQDREFATVKIKGESEEKTVHISNISRII